MLHFSYYSISHNYIGNKFILLIIFTIILLFLFSSSSIIIEGLDTNNDTTYQEYDVNKYPGILEQQNAGNIEYLKQQIENLPKIQLQLQTVQNNLTELQTQVNDLMQAQQNYTSQLTNNNVPQITGIDENNTNDKLNETDFMEENV